MGWKHHHTLQGRIGVNGRLFNRNTSATSMVRAEVCVLLSASLIKPVVEVIS